MNTYQTVVHLQAAAAAHPGGAYYGWMRDMARNRYTIDPKRPERDAQDVQKDDLMEQAAQAALRFCEARASEHGNLPAEINAVKAWGWLV